MESKNYINEFIGFMKSEAPRHVRQTGQRTAGDRHSFEFSAHASVYSRGFPCIFFFCHVPSQYSNKLCGYARSHYSQRSSIYGCCDHLQAQRISITF